MKIILTPKQKPILKLTPKVKPNYPGAQYAKTKALNKMT